MIEKTSFIVPNKLYARALQNIPTINDKIVLNSPTGRFFYDPWIIKEEFKYTVWNDILKTLPTNIGEARLIKLNSGTCYFSHSDIDDRYHLSLTGEKSYLVDLDNDKMYYIENKEVWYSMNTGIRHSAVNFGSVPRVQLVVRQLLPEKKEYKFKKIKIDLNSAIEDSRYYFDDKISPLLNHYCKIGVLHDFLVECDKVTFNLHIDYVSSILEKNSIKCSVTSI